MNHYLQQIHEHYDAYYVQNDFGHISVLTVWADNCSEQFKSRYQLGWSVLYVNKTTLDVIHLFFFCPQHGKGPPDGLGGDCKNVIRELRKNFEGTFLLPMMFTCGCKLTLQLFSLLGLVYSLFGNIYSGLFQQELSQHIILLNPQNLLVFLISMHLL